MTELCGSAEDLNKNNSYTWEQKENSKWSNAESIQIALTNSALKNHINLYLKQLTLFQSFLNQEKKNMVTLSTVAKVEIIKKSLISSLQQCLSTSDNLKLCLNLNKNIHLSFYNLIRKQFNVTSLSSLDKKNIVAKFEVNLNIMVHNFTIEKDVEAYVKNIQLLQENLVPPAGNQLTLAQFITRKILMAESDIASSLTACHGLPSRIKKVEDEVFSNLKLRLSQRLVDMFARYYSSEVKQRLGNCNRQPLANYIQDKIQSLNTFFISPTMSNNHFFARMAGYENDWPAKTLIEHAKSWSSKFAYEYVEADAYGYFDHERDFIYLGNYYVQPNFFMETTYAHEMGHAFDRFAQHALDKNSNDYHELEQIKICLMSKHTPIGEIQIKEDFADWFKGKFYKSGTPKQRRQDLCETHLIENKSNITQFKYEAFDVVPSLYQPYTSLIFRLLHDEITQRDDSSQLSLTCQKYLATAQNNRSDWSACE